MSSHGTKVTDPTQTINESTGAVASDSLAAESTRSGGGFSSNPNSTPLGVSGSNSTFANTNTSGATRLDPASDAETRMAQEDWAEERKVGSGATSYPNAAGGQSKALAVEDTTGSYQTGGNTSSAGTAPSYVNSQGRDESGPHGKNVTEGGFESNDRKNASFNGDIGGKNDPGRAAISGFQRANAEGGGVPPKQAGGLGESGYDVLGDTEA